MKMRRTWGRLVLGALVLGALVFGLTASRVPVVMVVTPSSFLECHGPDAAVKVRWRVMEGGMRPPVLPVSLYVNRLGRPEKLWATMSATGEATTGPWMADGSSVTLRDARGRFLARRTITALMPRGTDGEVLAPALAAQCKPGGA